jgi:RHS repeat-associated protein
VIIHSGPYAGEILDLHTDHLGTPRAIVQPGTQQVVWRWALNGSAFGEHAPDADPDGDGLALEFNLRYPGQYYDVESGLSYNYFRDYEPGTGRYVESDPIGLYGSITTYGYADLNPLMVIDPDGLFPTPRPKPVISCGMVKWVTKAAGKAAVAELKCDMPDEDCYEKCACMHKVRLALCLLNPACGMNSKRKAEACTEVCAVTGKYPRLQDAESN